MKIIHVVLGKANPNRMNGVNKVANSLCTTQTQLGHNVTVWGITADPTSGYPERNYNTQLFKSNKLRFVLDPAISKAINQLLDQPVIFHIHGGFIAEFYSLSVLLRKANIPYVITGHGAYNKVAMDKSKWRKKIYFSLFEKPLVSNAGSIHFLGESEENGLRLVARDMKPMLIPNGTELDQISTIRKAPKNKEMVFGFCGRIDIHTKGLDLLIKGFSNFIKLHKHAKLILIGDGADRQKLQQACIDLNILESVKFLGSKFGQEKYDIISTFDAFYHPSRNEGLPTAVLEASALQIPCVVSRESNMADYIQNYAAGVGLTENTAQKITESMVTICDLKRSGKIAEMKQNCTQMVQQEFDWKVISKKLVTNYMQILQTKESRATESVGKMQLNLNPC